MQDGGVDKAWHGIHYLLTRTAWEGRPPLNFLLAGGRALSSIDVGYGPARVLTAAEVREIAGALEGITDDWLRGRFDAADMMAKEIYPEIWDRDPSEDDSLGYCIEMFRHLQEYFALAAKRGLGVIISMQ
jgi:hypothetical protein